MSNLITLTCPSCGGRLEVTNDVDRYVCAHCGNAHLIEQNIRVRSLVDEVEVLKNESAIKWIDQEIQDLEKQKLQLQAKTLTLGNPAFEAALVKWFLVVVLVVAAFAATIFCSYIANAGTNPAYLILMAPFLVAAAFLGKYGLVDRRTMDAWRARHKATTSEINNIERQIARKREELERRKALSMSGNYQQPATSN